MPSENLYCASQRLVERRASARPLELKLCSFATTSPFPCSIRRERHFESRLDPYSAYLARLNTASTRAPSVVEGLTYFNSSVVRRVIISLSSSPSEFGYVLPSTRNMTVLSSSLTEYVPK